MDMLRSEYPRPQFVRDAWMNLNGSWQFELDLTGSGLERGLHRKERLDGQICVPFCPESSLSGVAYKDFIRGCCYKRSFLLTQDWLSGHVLLHFGAVNYACKVFVNGKEAGSHSGGYASFTLDIRPFVQEGENQLVVYASSDVGSRLQPSGKQSPRFGSFGCFYTRTTGIWQTVWLEHVADAWLDDVHLRPDPDNACVHVALRVRGTIKARQLKLTALYEGSPMGEEQLAVSGDFACGCVKLAQTHLWEVGQGRLYDLTLTLMEDGRVVDTLKAYFGLRTVTVRDGMVYLNGKPLYQRLVLDQGFYPDGIITAPSDAELRADIERSMALGFNGARLHQKVFEARFLYWADRLGYVVWGEYPNWGLDTEDQRAMLAFCEEWREVMARDDSSPALIGWCPFNETSTKSVLPIFQSVYRMTKALDPTRLCIDTSGWTHCGETDIYDYHDYEQDPEIFAQHVRCYAQSKAGEPFPQIKGLYPYVHRDGPAIISQGQPIFISEFGGIGWDAEQGDQSAWSYGTYPVTEEEFLARLEGLANAVLTTEGICGFCYTQLTDVEQEINGLYTYGRKPKFDPQTIHAILSRRAWCEEE